MKEMTSTNNSNPTATFVYSTLLNEILVNEEYTKFDLTWDALKYRESYLSGIENRNPSMEFRLKWVNTLIMDYHLHRPLRAYFEFENDLCYEIHDINPAESKAVLLQAKDLAEIILQDIFIRSQPAHTDYSLLAIALMLKIYRELENYYIHLNPQKELERLLLRHE